MKREEVYDLFKEKGIHFGGVPRDFDIEKDYYDKGVIRGEDLVDGKYYVGKCRNAHIGKWNGTKKVMEHQRFSWGQFYKDDVNYLDNDNNYDLFVAIKEIDEKDVPEGYIVN